MPKTFYQITKNEKHEIKNKAEKNKKQPGKPYCFGAKIILKIFGHER